MNRIISGQAALLSAALMVGAVATQPKPGQPTDTFVRSERWLDPVSGEMKGPVVIQVTGDRITRVVPAADFEATAAGTVIDLGTATILPGLTDAHVHLQIGGTPDENARSVLRAGFTTVVDLGATSDVVLQLRDRIAKGTVEGPRILAAGKWVGTKGGICEFGGIGVAGGPTRVSGSRPREPRGRSQSHQSVRVDVARERIC